jgi:hypothetical protein
MDQTKDLEFVEALDRSDNTFSTTLQLHNHRVFRRSVLRSVASYIIANEFCERLAFYGFAGSLVLFFQVVNLSNFVNFDDISLPDAHGDEECRGGYSGAFDY